MQSSQYPYLEHAELYDPEVREDWKKRCASVLDKLDCEKGEMTYHSGESRQWIPQKFRRHKPWETGRPKTVKLVEDGTHRLEAQYGVGEAHGLPGGGQQDQA